METYQPVNVVSGRRSIQDGRRYDSYFPLPEERDHGNRWSIISQGNTDIMPFSPQEADYVEKLIKTSGKQNKLAQSVLSKIKQSLQVQVSANLMFQAHLGQIVCKYP